jgi:hypothetical protein
MTLNASKHSDRRPQESPADLPIPKKKAYQKPAFRHERVFETMALACGKIDPTEGGCHLNRKVS